MWAVIALFLWEIVARLCVGRHVSRAQWGVSLRLPSPAEIRNVYRGGCQGQPVRTAHSNRHLIKIKITE